jgi:eukaryotic-like serine/threonine-protein kinase
MGNLDQGTGRFDEALASFSRALAIIEGTLGADHPQAGALLLNIGETHRAAARFEEALRHQRRAAEVFAAHFSEGHPYRGYAEAALAGSLVGLGRAEEAVEYGERALAIVAELGDPHYAAECRFVLAQALWASNRDRRRALALARAAHDALEGSDDPNIVRRRGEIEAWLSGR